MRITGGTKLVGVIGDPVEHSRSPQMHNAAFEELGLDYVYVPFHVRAGRLRQAIEGLKALGVVGVNVTIPHKEGALELADEASEEAKLIGAANTLTFKGERVIADNTDGRGFLMALKAAGIEVPEAVLVLGAGGTARAVTVALAREGVEKLTIANRTVSRAEELAGSLKKSFPALKVEVMPLEPSKLKEAVKESGLLVNATSVGMKEDDPMLIDPEWLHPELAVYDVIYTPPKTKLVEAAERKGLRCAGGVDMLVYQGAISFEIWTGRKAPIDRMRSALLKALGLTG